MADIESLLEAKKKGVVPVQHHALLVSIAA